MTRIPSGLLPLTAVLVLAAPGVAQSATITVTTTDDAIANDTACSLREAVISANTDNASSSGAGGCTAGNGNDTIVLPAGRFRLTRTAGTVDTGTPDPTAFDLDVTADATIRGAGAGSTTIDANAIDRAIDAFANLRVEDLTITGGRAKDAEPNLSAQFRRSLDGGGIRAMTGNLTLTDDAFVDNRADAGEAGASSSPSGAGALAFAGAGAPAGVEVPSTRRPA